MPMNVCGGEIIESFMEGALSCGCELAADARRQEAAVRSAQATLRDLLAGARREEIEDARAALQSAEATRLMTGFSTTVTITRPPD